MKAFKQGTFVQMREDLAGREATRSGAGIDLISQESPSQNIIRWLAAGDFR